MVTQTPLAPQLESIAGAAGVVSRAQLEAPLANALAQTLTPNTQIDCTAKPNTQAELAEIIALAHRNRWGVLPCGSGSKLSWGGLAGGARFAVSTERLNQLIDHAAGDLTVTAEAGMKFAHLQQILASLGQFLALDPAFPQMATLGGIVATGDSGFLRHRYGGVRDQLIGFSFVRSDGQIAKAGGRVVKNVAGYDLMKLFTGSYGTLGIICQVTFRVYPLPAASQTVALTGTPDAIARAAQTLLGSALTPTAVELLSPQLVASCLGKPDTGLLVRFQSIPESVQEQSARLLEVGQALGLEGSTCLGDGEAQLWQKLREQLDAPAAEPAILCKIGVRPSLAAGALSQLLALLSPSGAGAIHAGSGLGVLRFAGENLTERVLKMRSACQEKGGFLTVLQAPVSVKQQLDVWGYTGNALDLMRRIKRQFDPENILSSGRFVGGI
ncbi:FAD-binding oxidoreductase [Kamptonema formosum]|uniref:FAD-binding oxidoreductase n=1 Tax=Kamptonema formosum TaxID=331992 RepID=UPI00034C9BD0|nr:FAD-binding oxidoreductase [Oscillatoria sp. PCC 10802]